MTYFDNDDDINKLSDEEQKEIIDNQKAFEKDNNLNINQTYKNVDIFVQDKDNHVENEVKRENTKYKYTKMSNFVLKLSRFYAPMSTLKLTVYTALFAVIFGVVGVFFVKNTGIYNFGLAALGQAISKITNVLLRTNPSVDQTIYNVIDHALFWILYLVLSIPIFIFGWKKVGKLYVLLTLEFLVISSLVSFGLGQIPWVNSFSIIGDFSHPEISNELKASIASEYWGGKTQLWSLIPLQWNDGGNIIAQILFAIAYGYMLAFFFAVIAIMGGSAGVTGIIGEYYSVVKRKNFGTINGYINFVILIVSVLIGSYFAGSLLINDIQKYLDVHKATLSASDASVLANIVKVKWSASLYFSPNIISTLICNFVFMAILNKLFPRFKIVQCKVYSPHMSAIKKVIIEDEKTINNFTITQGIGGYSGEGTKVLASITLYKQIPRLIKLIRSVDQNALITVSDIASVDGNIYMPTNKF